MKLQHIYLMLALHTTKLLDSISLRMLKGLYLTINFFKQNLKVPLSYLCIVMIFGFFQNSFASSGLKSDPQLASQAEKFYERLRAKYPDINFSDTGIEGYYQKMDSISNPHGGNDSWSISSVEHLGKKMLQQADGTYICGDISFKINSSERFDATQKMTILVNVNGKNEEIECPKDNEIKKTCLPAFSSYHDLVNDKFTLGAFLLQKVKHQVILTNSHDESYVIDIESENKQHYPLKIQGMMIVYDKIRLQTNVFLDFTAFDGQIINYLDPVFSCKHKKDEKSNKKVSYIRQHELFECDVKNLFGYFDTPENYNNWIKDGIEFYDIKKQRTLNYLSSYYDNNTGVLKEPLIWVSGNDTEQDSFYEMNKDITLDHTNNYIYSSNDGRLSATLKYAVTAKEYCIGKNKKSITLQCLEPVVNPSLKLHEDITIVGGRRPWLKGIYKKTVSKDKIVWQRIEGPMPDEVIQIVRADQAHLNLNYGLVVDSWSNAKVSAQEGKNWCDAAQQFFHHFNAKINHCDKEMLQKFPTWSKLINLNASHLHLDDETITMPTVLKTIGSLKQLTSLDFSHNSPIIDFNKNYNQMANEAETTFVAVGDCLNELKNLKILRLHGLWLRHHTLLGKGVQDGISKEVAILTGIMNHGNHPKNGCGLKSIINSVNKLPVLEDLSVDAIPVNGSSFVARHEGLKSYLLATMFMARFCDCGIQEEELKRISKNSAEELAKISSLKTVYVCSPGGNTVDYFSKEFKDNLKKAPRAKDLKELVVIPATLD